MRKERRQGPKQRDRCAADSSAREPGSSDNCYHDETNRKNLLQLPGQKAVLGFSPIFHHIKDVTLSREIGEEATFKHLLKVPGQ